MRVCLGICSASVRYEHNTYKTKCCNVCRESVQLKELYVLRFERTASYCTAVLDAGEEGACIVAPCASLCGSVYRAKNSDGTVQTSNEGTVKVPRSATICKGGAYERDELTEIRAYNDR